MVVTDKEYVPNKLVSWIIAAILLLIVYNEMFVFKPIYPIYCLIMAVVAVYLSIKKNGKEQRFLGTIVFVMIAVWIWCVLLGFIQGSNKPMKFRELEYLLLGGLLVSLFCKARLSTLPLYLAYYLVVLFFYYQYFVNGVESYGVLDKQSGAINTIILLSFSIAIQVVDYRDNQRIALLPSIVILPIAVMSWNRTGLIASIIYILAVSFIGTSRIQKKNIRLVLFFFITVFFTVLVLLFYSWFQNSMIFAKFQQQGFDTARTQIWNDYFSSFGVMEVFFGKAIDETHLLLGNFTNPHNSFIMLHSQTGIVGIVFIIIVVKTLIEYWGKNKLVFMLFLVLVLRCFFDMAFFFQPYDFAFYLFVVGKNDLISKRVYPKITLI